MDDVTNNLRDRLQTLLNQAQRDRAALQPFANGGDAVYTRLIDSLSSALHNLSGPQAIEKRDD